MGKTKHNPFYPYAKHSIYWGVYETDGESADISDNAEWIVMKYEGYQHPFGGVFSEELDKPGPVALILYDKEKSFWAVISFLTKSEVKKLIEKLQKALEGVEK